MLNEKEKVVITSTKALLIIMVIISHCFSYYGRTTDLSSAEWGMQYLLYATHVPIFILLAGFLCHKQSVIPYLNKKLHRILIPFMFFSGLKCVYTVLAGDPHVDSGGGILYEAFIIGQTYWFGYAIFMMFLIAPLIWSDKDCNVIPKKAIVLLVCLLLFNVVYSDLNKAFLPKVFQIESTVIYLPYFLEGLIGRQYYADAKNYYIAKKKWILSVSVALIVVSLVLYYTDNRFNEFIIKFITAIAALPLIFEIARLIPLGLIKTVGIIGSYSWQLMLLDGFYRVILFSAVSRLFTLNSGLVWVIVCLDIALGVMTCKIVKRIPGLRFLFGLQ